jgi:hypothetical protein
MGLMKRDFGERNVRHKIAAVVSWVAIELSLRKNSAERLGMVFVIPRNKVLILCDSKYFGRVHSVSRNETERLT